MRFPKWVCGTCGQPSSRKWNIERHITICHRGVGRYLSYMDYMTGSRNGFYRRSHHDMFQVQNSKEVNLLDVMQAELVKETVRQRFRGIVNQFVTTPNPIRSDQTYISSAPTVPIHQNINIGKITNSEDHIDDRNAIFAFTAEICITCWHLSVEPFYFDQQSDKRSEKNLGHVCHHTELHNIPRYTQNNLDLEPKEVEKVLLPLFLREYITKQWATRPIYLLAYEVSNRRSQDFTLMDSKNQTRRITIKSAEVKLVELDLRIEDLSHWASRAITNNFTLMNETELDNYLHKIENASFALFKVYSESSVEFYFMALSILPVQIVLR
jgi:hypothetical protein